MMLLFFSAQLMAVPIFQIQSMALQGELMMSHILVAMETAWNGNGGVKTTDGLVLRKTAPAQTVPHQVTYLQGQINFTAIIIVHLFPGNNTN